MKEIAYLGDILLQSPGNLIQRLSLLSHKFHSFHHHFDLIKLLGKQPLFNLPALSKLAQSVPWAWHILLYGRQVLSCHWAP